MTLRRKTNPLWGLIVFAIALILLARALGVIPDALYDLIVRAAPALLILAGAAFILQERVPLGSLIALVVSLAIVGGIAYVAYSTRSNQVSEETRQPISQAIAPDLTLLRVRIGTLATAVDIISGAAGSITGEFVGSADNRINVNYEQLPDNSATLTLSESEADAFPRLETLGRGRLSLSLPVGVPLDIEYVGAEGVVLNMSDTRLERLNVTAGSGDVVITLPEYDPLYSQDDELLGTLTAQQGDLAIFIPASVAARLELDSTGRPQYDPDLYNYLIDGDVLESRQIAVAAITVRYAIVVPNGQIRLEVPGA